MPTIRRATPDDIPALARTLALAFANYSWTRWTVPADDHLDRLERLFTLDLTMAGIPQGETWMTDDGSAVAVWIPPRHLHSHTVDWERHAALSAPLLGERMAVADAAEAAVAPHRPGTPAWYLATMAVHPDHQRRGLGSAVLEPTLARCDRDGMPCLTETSSADNVRFYARLGFTTHADVATPDGGPTVWVMWRPAAGAIPAEAGPTGCRSAASPAG